MSGGPIRFAFLAAGILLVLGLIKVWFLYLEPQWFYFPDPSPGPTPQSLGLVFEDLSIPTPDGQTLHGWYLPATPGAKTVLFFHGNGGNISYSLERLRFFHSLGWNALIFDYRGYGQSTGRPKEKGLYQDARAAYDFLIGPKRIPPEQMVIYGKSLGGAVAADLCNRRKARALILESSPASSWDMAGKGMGAVIARVLLNQSFATYQKVRRAALPKLILHSRGDETVGFRHAQKIWENAAAPKRFQEYSGLHNDEEYVTSEAFGKLLLDFLQ